MMQLVQAELLAYWPDSRAPLVQDLVRRYPANGRYWIEGQRVYLLGYIGLPDFKPTLFMSVENPAEDFLDAFENAALVPASYFDLA